MDIATGKAEATTRAGLPHTHTGFFPMDPKLHFSKSHVHFFPMGKY